MSYHRHNYNYYDIENPDDRDIEINLDVFTNIANFSNLLIGSISIQILLASFDLSFNQHEHSYNYLNIFSLNNYLFVSGILTFLKFICFSCQIMHHYHKNNFCQHNSILLSDNIYIWIFLINFIINIYGICSLIFVIKNFGFEQNIQIYSLISLSFKWLIKIIFFHKLFKINYFNKYKYIYKSR